MSTSIIELLGLDEEDFSWQQLSLCSGMDTELFYDQYESSSKVAKQVDQMCLSCPVMNECLQWGTENSETGVWGGIYLVSGKVDNNRNSHKTEDVWAEIRNRISGNSVH